MKTFTQKHGFEKRSYTIHQEEGVVDVHHKDLKKQQKFQIELLDIGNKIQYEQDNTLPGKITLVIFIAIALSCTIYYFYAPPDDKGSMVVGGIVFTALALFGYFKPHTDDLIIAGGNKTIRLFRKQPNQKIVLDFANSLIASANEKRKEIAINFTLEKYEFEANLKWLLANKIIDQEEYESLLQDYEINRIIMRPGN
ncbi:hypothetical protein [Marinirhabdus gelatinilytica]|uniref:Uncharacterized protein n=1 Tax=Marinirhabdus gelatinilytica TaxID=1703343 RepID=A0A370QIX0_9FLAO|nr:hypothetical protein [Marinirhabdus gelatinilytica]RDK88314.1 hypothetical protein C8D94_101184 [Marinirhabdus gelatinilytica]